ncbi:hypothetical protein V8B97DRAFT_2022177 [Scleroderma yunnanense]
MQLEDALGSKEAGIDSEQEAHLILNYPPSGQGELLTCPTVVLGNGGTIALWYLPNALSCAAQATILQSLLPLQEQLASSIVAAAEDDRLVGCLEFTPASHMQGHMTCLFGPMILMDLNTNTMFQWANNMTILNSILSGALSVMHLQLYDAGIQGIWRMKYWATDNHPHISWYDILASVSDYKDCIMHIPSLGIDLMYSLGTVVAFSGCLLLHGVNSVEGNRNCLTYYVWDNIHNFVGHLHSQSHGSSFHQSH